MTPHPMTRAVRVPGHISVQGTGPVSGGPPASRPGGPQTGQPRGPAMRWQMAGSRSPAPPLPARTRRVRIAASLLALATLAGCVSEQAREARCACFKADGTPTGRCDFTPLPGGGSGGEPPAVFRFLDADPASPTLSPTAILSTLGGRCGD